jgi:glycosyltransferase involved in cell wall biosynthesis
VARFTRHNDAIKGMPSWKVALRTIWNRQTIAELRSTIRRERPAIVHFTNTFPLISPSAYYAARREGVKIVQSLHNYRLLCPNALFLRDGKVCELCLGRAIPWPAVRYACYRDNRPATAAVAAMLTFHRAIGTWSRVVDLFCALTEFGKQKFIEGGLPADKVAVKPNFMRVDPGPGDGAGGYAVFVGRLSAEKGLETVLSAWLTHGIDLPLWIVGDGPLAPRVQQAAAENQRVTWLGRQPPERVLEIVGGAALLVLPSVWYEGFPKTIVEAFSKGTPVVTSNLGSMAEVVEDRRTGRLVAPGNAASLAEAIQSLAADAQTLRNMRLAARTEFEQKYTAEVNYQILLALYRRASGEKHELPADQSTTDADRAETHLLHAR